MKQCKTCKQTKSFIYFTKNKRESDGYRRICKICTNKYEKERYEKNNSVKMIQTIGQLNRKNRNRLHLYNYLKDKSCVDCGETDPVVLDFDHIKDKKYNISYLIALGYSISKIDEEINKCEIRCANCHRRKTSKQLGWYDKNNPTISNRYNILKSLRKTMILGIRGSQVKSSKLKEEEVIDIKNLLKSGKTATEIAVIYGLSLKSICNIKNNKTWKHVIV